MDQYRSAAQGLGTPGLDCLGRDRRTQPWDVPKESAEEREDADKEGWDNVSASYQTRTHEDTLDEAG